MKRNLTIIRWVIHYLPVMLFLFYFCIILDTDKEKCNMLVYLYSFLRHG